MDLKTYLAEQGYTPEEITAVLADVKMTKVMTSALAKYDEGTTAAARAAAEKAETATYWEEQTQKLQGSVNRLTAAEKRAATAESEAARRTAYLKSLKDQGYDVPEEMIGAAAATPPQDPATGKYITREDLEKGVRSTAPDLVSLTALSNEYRSLFGDDYTSIEEDFAAARAAGKPLREYARNKYNFEAKRAEKNKKAEDARIEILVAERLKPKEAELAAKYGSNPDTRSPMPSKFDQLTSRPNFKSDSWKSPEGRKQNRADRLKQFENISLKPN